ncbi:transglycosylase SLT domain-containing protein [Chryseosolibacter indicus]|uniref:Lytic transglycosylase domain-containing protein n=1 Tax=Chryseosolibacter indicus TaxID=2782351 RepID=A0ABS5VML0_9BACT|nr:transglycosylase SLT domain-containing protein [Chryseosolibacter indicus]MBT1702685.1 lytic transglycosylase domain-containing protein [Chryseosolibacter indicus]
MKTISHYLSIATLVILLGYIAYNEISKKPAARPELIRRNDSMSDENDMDPAYILEDVPSAAISFDLPAKIDFANEVVPLNIPDVRERLDKEIQINTYLHSNTIFLIKRAKRWLPQMEEILKKNGIPLDFKYLPLIESNLINVVSPKEAAGYWQILKTSGKEFGLEINDEVDERYDPLKSTEAACKYLNQAYKKFGNWTLVAASYNRGMSGVQRALDDQEVDNYYDLYLNEETSRYVFRILAIKEIVQNPTRYGFKINPKHLYDEEPLKYVEVDETIKDLVRFAKQQGSNYKLLKRHNPWLREDKLTVKKGKTYKIAFPEKTD